MAEVQGCDIGGALNQNNAVIAKYKSDEFAAMSDEVRWTSSNRICRDNAVPSNQTVSCHTASRRPIFKNAARGLRGVPLGPEHLFAPSASTSPQKIKVHDQSRGRQEDQRESREHIHQAPR